MAVMVCCRMTEVRSQQVSAKTAKYLELVYVSKPGPFKAFKDVGKINLQSA